MIPSNAATDSPCKFRLKAPFLLRRRALINGEWVDADSGATSDNVNPATGELLGTAPHMGSAEARRAIEAAARALGEWSARTARERSQILRRWLELTLEHSNDLARLLTIEQGKPLRESLAEVQYGASFLEWFAEEATRVYGDIIPSDRGDRRILVLRQPIGVTAAITAWNFPIALLFRKTAPALAAGCTQILKPAPQTPYITFALAELGLRAGIPPGVFNVVTGDAGLIGAEMTSHPAVRLLSFTGSTAVGRHLMRSCADTVKKVDLELGGNAPFIVFDDADIDGAVNAAIDSKFRNAGQTCICANRIFVHDRVYDEFGKKLADRVKSLRVGHGLVDGTDIGPLTDDAALRKVQRHVDDAVAKGAEIAAGGHAHPLGRHFFEPTVLLHTTPAMLLAAEETFGPVAALFRFGSEREAVELANATESGLAGYVCTRDLGRAWRMAEALQFGVIGVNTGTVSTAVAPFGGIKQSGLGREGSRYGIDEFVEKKYVCLSGLGI
jgi:succinate-semialdehyde dehydrogenase / glutarate-semialdehyde dehydrogenase